MPGPTPEQPACPFCRSDEVSLHSPFGTTQLVRQFYCRSCRSVFESVKWKKRTEKREEKY